MIQSSPNTELEPVKKPANRIWILVVVAVIMLAAGGMFFMRQHPAPPAPAAVKAAPSLEKVSSYHLKYKHTMNAPSVVPNTSYYEYWYQSPTDWKLTLTQGGPGMVQIFNNGIRWFYNEGSGVAFKTLVSDNEVQMNINSPFAPKLGKEYKKTGTSRVVNRDCDVIEGDLPGNRHVKVCVDRDTGIVMLTVDTKKGKLFFKQEVVTFEVNKSLPKDTFVPKLPANTFVIKSTAMISGLSGLDIKAIKSIADNGSNENPFGGMSLQDLADKGAMYNAPLKQIYEPEYLPDGYAWVSTGGNNERSTMPDGTISYRYTGKHSTVSTDYLDPKTGDTIILEESINRRGKNKDREISNGDFHRRIAAHEKPFPYTELFWQIDGAYLSLSATALSEQEIVKVAKSMRFVKPTTQKSLVSRKPSNGKIAGKLEFRYLSSVKSQKHPNAKYNMTMSKDNDGRDINEFIDSKGKTVDPKKIIGESPLILSEADLKPVTEVVPGYDANPVISIEFTPEGRKKFADFTRTHIDEYLAIIIDGKILSVPVIRAPILDGKAVIEGGFKTLDEAQSLADALNKGGSAKR